MGFLIGLLTIVMVLDCAVLIGLILIQLPKKDAGGGVAFGGGAADALFGAGSGNVLTKITKYSATTFFVLAVILSVMQSSYHSRTSTTFMRKLSAPAPLAPSPTPVTPPQEPATVPPKPTIITPAPAPTSNQVTTPAIEATNIPSATSTSAAPATAPK
jgi:preprotein translocase subunit SecG